MSSLNALIERGHSVLIIEHNMDVIKCADYVIDLGPEGGKEGGRIVYRYTGTSGKMSGILYRALSERKIAINNKSVITRSH